MNEKNTSGAPARRFGLAGLTAIVFGTMVGGGIFNVAQNMAIGASAPAVLAAWLATAAGILTLVVTFKILSDERPDLNAGIYEYAREGFGDYVGFNIAWGYWLCVGMGNVAYAVMLNDALGAFFPSLLDHSWPTIIFGFGFIWTMYALVVSGMRTASGVNIAMTVVKFSAIALIVALLIARFSMDEFVSGFTSPAPTEDFGAQVKNAMVIALWCFIGVEGAVMMSARAKRPRDVGRAGLIGFGCAWVLYALVSLLSYGVMSQAELAGLPNPSLAYVLKATCGPVACYFVIVSVIVSLVGSWIAWTLVCAQTPYEAAVVKIFPRRFLRVNHRGVPTRGLFVSSVFVSLFLVMVCSAEQVYIAALDLTSVMVLPAYFFSGLYLWMSTGRRGAIGARMSRGRRIGARAVGVVCTLYCLWMLYAGNLSLLLLTTVFYLAGTPFYISARREYAAAGKPLFSPRDRGVVTVLSVCAVTAVVLYALGVVRL